MRYAIVSDIHANLQAWEETLNDIMRQNVDATICLGDIVGYGPQPRPVLESVCEYVDDIVIGNHDAAVSGRCSTDFFGQRALLSLEWTRDRLDDESVAFLGELPSLIEGDTFALAHAEALDPEVFGYIENPTDARLNLECNDYPILFVGHTHVPDIFALSRADHTAQRIPPSAFTMDQRFRYVVNVGSVGDPRDGSSEASYCIFDDESGLIVFRRVSFDVEAFMRDMADNGLRDTPYFVQAASHPGILPATGDWAMEMAPRDHGPGQAGPRIARVSQTEGWLDEEQEAEAERARIRRQRVSQALRRSRIEEENRRRAQVEALRETLRQRQMAAEQQRLAEEEEQRRQEEEQRMRDEELHRKSLELLLNSKEREEERKREKVARAIALKNALREKQEAARRNAEIRRQQEEREREEREKKLQQRKLELARAAEERKRKRLAEREAHAAELRALLDRKRAATGSEPPDASEVSSIPSPDLNKTREIVLPGKKNDASVQSDTSYAQPSQHPSSDDPTERRRAIARAAAEKKRLRQQEDLLRKQKIREAILRKQQAARNPRPPDQS